MLFYTGNLITLFLPLSLISLPSIARTVSLTDKSFVGVCSANQLNGLS